MTFQFGTLLLAVTLGLARSSFAVTWRLTAATTSPELANSLVDVDPYNIPPDCNVVGVCVPFNLTLKNNTLWYWCGWSSIQRTDYIVSAASGATTAELMRQSTFNDCVGPNTNGLKNIGKCETIFSSVTDTKVNYTQRVLGLAFSDPICLLIANNNNFTVTLGVQVFQRFDSPRYYGTIFSIILTILLFGGATAYIGYTCYMEIVSTPDRIGEMRSFEQQLQRSETMQAEADVDASDPTDPGTFQGRIKVALTKVKGLVTRSKAAQM